VLWRRIYLWLLASLAAVREFYYSVARAVFRIMTSGVLDSAGGALAKASL
jgi:hypothetical protein